MQCKKQHIEVIKYSGLEKTKKLLDYILVYDDSCTETFNDKEVVKIELSGGHRKLARNIRQKNCSNRARGHEH